MTNEELLVLVKKNPIGVGCGLLALGLGAAIYFRGSELPAAEEELAQKSAEAERYAANLQNAAQLKEQYDELEAANKEVDARLVHASDPLRNYQFFYKLQAETNTKMTVINQAPVQAAKGGAKTAFIPVPFNITVQGTLPQILDYLRRLESGARYARVVSVTCGVPTSDRNAPLTLALNLELLGLP